MELADPLENPKSETRNPKEIRNPKSAGSGDGEVRVSALRLPSDFGLRDSDLYQPHTLRAELDNSRLPAAHVLDIGLALSEALAHLHAKGLVHRDVKPSNVIFVNGRPKLADIGLVTDASDQCSIVGTEGYLPPEGPGTPQADIFALGKVLYEAATGMDRREFPKLPEDLRQWPDARLVVELNEIVLRACSKDTANRYKSTQELLDDLARLRKGRSVMRQRIWHRRLRAVRSAGFVIAALALAAAGGIVLWRMVRQNEVPVVLVGEAPEILSSNDHDAIEAFRAGRDWLLRATPDGYTKAVSCFTRAIELDPKFWNAYARLFETYLLGEDRGLGNTQTAGAEKLNALATMLQKIAPTNADTYAAVAVMKFMNERRWVDAETEFNKALAADPKCRMALTYYGYFLTRLRRVEAARKVLDLAQSPRNPVIGKFIGHCEYAQRHFEQAALLYAHVYSDLEPSYPSAHYWAGRAFMAMTNYFEGARQFQEQDKLGGNEANSVAKYELRQKGFEQGGPRGFWTAIIAEQKANESNTAPYVVATRYAMLPDKEEALKWLEIAQQKNNGMENLLFDDCWDKFRKEPRFRKVVEQVGLKPWEWEP
jgi:tetratricopeptide (TPR) repeat protein